MIKRNGIELMNARTKNVSIARETIKICKDKQYTSLNGTVVDISEQLNFAIKNTVLYPYDYVFDIKGIENPISPVIEVTSETTAQAASRLGLLGKSNIVALNFASARNQGGGFLSGAVAQEEDLCRCSGLYPCLLTKPMFYNKNVQCDDTFYTDGIIYSPNVPFFRDENNIFIDFPFFTSIITCPAPNLREVNKGANIDKIKATIEQRTIKILKAAYLNGHKNIILGAWGAGAFGNDPEMIAEGFKMALTKAPYFEHVCFAIYDNRPEQPVLNTFKKYLDPRF
jgi:uncharacterized protein (TIGR02452 family)